VKTYKSTLLPLDHKAGVDGAHVKASMGHSGIKRCLPRSDGLIGSEMIPLGVLNFSVNPLVPREHLGLWLVRGRNGDSTDHRRQGEDGHSRESKVDHIERRVDGISGKRKILLSIIVGIYEQAPEY